MAVNQSDTIVAISTPPGIGGLGVIRISGSAAFEVADRVFRCPGGAKLCDAQSHTIHYGHITDLETGEVIDEAMAALMRCLLYTSVYLHNTR